MGNTGSTIDAPDKLLTVLAEDTSPETAVAVYKYAASFVELFRAVMTSARENVAQHVRATGEIRGRTEIGTFGKTQPKKKFALDDMAWRMHLAQSPAVRAIEDEYAAAKAHAAKLAAELDAAKQPFMTKDVTPGGIYFIK